MVLQCKFCFLLPAVLYLVGFCGVVLPQCGKYPVFPKEVGIPSISSHLTLRQHLCGGVWTVMGIQVYEFLALLSCNQK